MIGPVIQRTYESSGAAEILGFFRGGLAVSASLGRTIFNSYSLGVPVNKQDLINEVAKVADLPKNKAQEAVEAIFESIKLTLKSGGEVRLVGFGTFTVSARAATTGRNPRTGEAINIPASKQPKFKAGKELKDAVND